MDVAVDIDVNDDGSGTVSVGVGVDDDLLSRVPARPTACGSATWPTPAGR